MVAGLYSALNDEMIQTKKKIQSAMEYLMTYGWAILIIAVVLTVLFSLGITNPLFFAPKAPPGGCRVVRPSGPGTSFDINLLGVCNGEIPEYTAQFNGQSSNILFPHVVTTNQGTTISVWFYSNAGMGSYGRVIVETGDGNGFGPALQDGEIAILESGITWHQTGVSFSTGKWYNVVISAFPSGSSVMYDIFVNGKLYQSGPYLSITPSGDGAIGKEICCGHFFEGSISNVQIYNSTLDSASVNALYREGIGGVPIDLQNLVGWWPLNNNANDYSGNGNNGNAIGVTYSSSWINSYTPQ